MSGHLCVFAAISGAAAVATDATKSPVFDQDDNGPPAWTTPASESQLWFDDCQKRINKIWGKSKKGDKITDDVRCAFFLKANGRPDGLFACNLGPPLTADAVAMKIVRKAAPFKNPPAYLLNERRILVTFSRSNGQLNSNVRWDRFDYTFVKPEDRLQDFPEKKRKHQDRKSKN
jgi:hypothetical protein